MLSQGASLAYSKPVGQIMLADMAAVKPTVMASVPRIWEGVRAAIYRNVNEEGGIKKALFGFFVAVGQAHATASALVRGLYPQFTRRSRVMDFLMGILPFLLLYPLRALGERPGVQRRSRRGSAAGSASPSPAAARFRRTSTASSRPPASSSWKATA